MPNSPAIQRSDANHIPPHWVFPGGHRESSTVLIVDDQPIGRDALEGVLLDQGFDLHFAVDGIDALSKAKDIVPDLILLDVMMPGMDGFEVCRRLRADPVLKEVPVIMVTALDDRDSRLRGIEAGADDFATKPFDRAELRARVRTITRLNRYRRLLSERLRFMRVVEQAGEGYLLLNSEDQILYANLRARQLLGIRESANEPPSESFSTMAHRYFQLEPEAAWKGWPTAMLEVRKRQLYLVRPETAQEQATWIEVEVLDPDTRSEGEFLVSLRDFTAEVVARRDIRRFHHAISHKLNTPLNLVLGGLEFLSEDGSALSGAQVSEMSSLVLVGARRLQSAVDDVLRYLNRPWATSPAEGCFPAQLPALVSETCGECEISKFSCTMADVPSVQLALTTAAMSTILDEIIENARKFHPQHAPTVEVVISEAAPGLLSLEIRDDGIHLSPEQILHAWDLYFQGEKWFTGEVPGMGLGLSLVASLVWGAGGRCSMLNRNDRPGIVVELVIPFQREEAIESRDGLGQFGVG